MKRDFDKSLAAGEKGETFVYGLLYSKYGNDQLKHVTEYYPKGFQWNGFILPDFLLKTEIEKFIEVKCKKGFKDYLNIDCKQVKDYIEVARMKKADIEVLFLCTKDANVYRLTEEDLLKPAKTITPREPGNNRDFYAYDKTGLEIVCRNIPRVLFDSNLRTG